LAVCYFFIFFVSNFVTRFSADFEMRPCSRLFCSSYVGSQPRVGQEFSAPLRGCAFSWICLCVGLYVALSVRSSSSCSSCCRAVTRHVSTLASNRRRGPWNSSVKLAGLFEQFRFYLSFECSRLFVQKLLKALITEIHFCYADTYSQYPAQAGADPGGPGPPYFC